jgi:tRNA(adenine34) deaminase
MSIEKFETIKWFMDIAFEEAISSYHSDEVPVGCVIVDQFGNVLAQAANKKEKNWDSTAHAEILAIRMAGQKLQNWRLTKCSIYLTLEPCLMCLSAIYQSRIQTVYFGAYDLKSGSLSKGINLNKYSFNHKVEFFAGINHYQNSQLLSQFFKEKRQNHQT